ncbi:MAG: hypothetical protein HUJ94_06480 [Bacteroidales bacterium]|nr:hypothetical protein [Bacteroidales bacterium]
MKKHICITLFSTVLVLASCAKDHSLDAAFDLADVSIATDDMMTFAVGEESTYEPVIEWAGTSPADYTYLWTLNGREEICNEQNLKYVFTKTGEQYLTFQMTDTRTGLVYGRDFKATVSSPFFLGWTVLSEDQGSKASLFSFVHMTSFKCYPDIYGSSYPDDPLGSEPYGLAFNGIAKSDQITVLQRKGGVQILDGATFGKVCELGSEFVGEKYPEEAGAFPPKMVAYTNRGCDLILTQNGTIYDRLTTSPTLSSTVFQSAMFTSNRFIHTAGDYNVTYMPTPGGPTYYQLMFDSLKKRWLAYHIYLYGQYAIPEFTGTAPAGVMDMAKGMGADVVYANTYNESGYKATLAGIYLKDGKYLLHKADLTLSTSTYKISVASPAQYEFAPGYQIDANTRFFIPRGTGTDYANDLHVFFSVGKKLYFFHGGTQQTYLYRDFGAGSNAPSGEIVDIQQNGNAKQLGVAFSDGHFFVLDIAKTNLTAIRQNNLDPTNADQLELAHIDNIPGRIVAIAFKYGKVANYTGCKIAY